MMGVDDDRPFAAGVAVAGPTAVPAGCIPEGVSEAAFGFRSFFASHDMLLEMHGKKRM